MTEMISNFPHFIIFEREEVSIYICNYVVYVKFEIKSWNSHFFCIVYVDFLILKIKKVGNWKKYSAVLYPAFLYTLGWISDG